MGYKYIKGSVKKRFKELDMRSQPEALGQIDRMIDSVIVKAAETAKNDNRKTVMPEHIPQLPA